MEIKTKCELCDMETYTISHHIIPRCKHGKKTIQACPTCEKWIHSQWTHNELRDIFNSVDAILANEGFQKFLKWRRKQPSTALFKSSPGKFRDKNPYH